MQAWISLADPKTTLCVREPERTPLYNPGPQYFSRSFITITFKTQLCHSQLSCFPKFFLSHKALTSKRTMRFVSIALVGLVSISVTVTSDFETWDDIVGDVPQCIKACLDDFYGDSGLEDECGSSDDASMDCLCSVTSFSSVQSSANDLSTCIQDSCDSGDLSKISSKLSDFQERFSDAGDQCMSEDKPICRLFHLCTRK